MTEKFFDFKISNKKFAVFNSLISNLQIAILLCVPVLIASLYLDSTVNFDLFKYIYIILIFTVLIIVLAGEMIYFKTGKGIRMTKRAS